MIRRNSDLRRESAELGGVVHGANWNCAGLSAGLGCWSLGGENDCDGYGSARTNALRWKSC